jgi:hypothetical protein
MPSRDEIVTMVELLRSVIFPGFFGDRDITEAGRRSTPAPSSTGSP